MAIFEEAKKKELSWPFMWFAKSLLMLGSIQYEFISLSIYITYITRFIKQCYQSSNFMEVFEFDIRA